MLVQTWELENNVEEVEADKIFRYDEAQQSQTQAQKPWTKDPHYFKKVRISALALLKMAVHARSGGTIEIMGIMQGKTEGDTMIVMDAFALPVEGTETRVNAQADAYEYMVEYAQANKQVRLSTAVYCFPFFVVRLAPFLWPSNFLHHHLQDSQCLDFVGSREYLRRDRMTPLKSPCESCHECCNRYAFAGKVPNTNSTKSSVPQREFGEHSIIVGYFAGWQTGKRRRLVSLASRVWLLVIRD